MNVLYLVFTMICVIFFLTSIFSILKISDRKVNVVGGTIFFINISRQNVDKLYRIEISQILFFSSGKHYIDPRGVVIGKVYLRPRNYIIIIILCIDDEFKIIRKLFW